MLEREQTVILPHQRSAYANAESIAPNLILISKGVEIAKKRYPCTGDRYEEQCFVEAMARNPGLIGIGPHMLDEALGNQTELSADSRPDTLLLTNNFCIRELQEFKSGRSNGIHKKIEGFAILLDKLRDNPKLLPKLLNRTLEKYGISDRGFGKIAIPPNEEIIVRFVSPFERPHIRDGELPFKIRFSVLEREN